MSVSSQELDRSILERKDRDELMAIAEAFGQKPGSRAKKADIVDLILEVTGAGPSSSGADAATDGAEAKPRRGRPKAKAGDTGASIDAAAGAAGAVSKPDDAIADAVAGGSVFGSKPDDEPANAETVTSAGSTSSSARALAPTAYGVVAPSEAQSGAHSTDGSGEHAVSGSDVSGRQSGTEERRDTADAGNRSETSQQGEQARQQGEQARREPTSRQHGQDGQQQARQHQGGNNQDGQKQGRQQQGGQQQGGQQQGGDADLGNRRRRRRNRDQRPQAEEVFQGEPVDVDGLLDLRDEGFGFLRVKGYLPSKDDVYVSVKQVRQFGLRKGDQLKGAARPATRNEKNPALLRIDLVNGQDPEKARQRPRFEDLTPLFPDEKLHLEVASDPGNMTARIVDLLAPIGKGQRGLIVSPPKAGKTTVMKTIARSIEVNNPEAHLIVLLVDERPEEVTDFKRWLQRGEVAASTFDRPSDEHTHVSELVIERAKRMVEEGKDVVIILDGITRLARAYNLAAPASGRIMSGGIDAGALYPPKKFFGAARNVEEGGSLTILATALVETNSRMDDAIFEEFKATGNMELKLDRKLADRRIYPAIDVDASGTRHEELLFERKQLQQVWKLRRVLSGLSADGGSNAPGLELLVDRMKTFKSNDEFLAEIAKAPSIS